jgi:hypothetical protein
MPTGPMGRRVAHPDLGGIGQADLPAGAQMGDHVGQGAQPDSASSVQPRSVSSGRTSPMAG